MEYLLTFITFIPLLAVLLILFIPKEDERTIKNLSIGISVLPLVLATYLWFALDKGAAGFQFETIVEWIPALNINYHVGADGLSVPLIFLTALLTTLSMIYSSFTIKTRVKEFFLLFFLLQMGMFGVFISLDLVLFYVFWEIGLVPMYLLIGIWGRPRTGPSTRPSSSFSIPWPEACSCCWPFWACTFTMAPLTLSSCRRSTRYSTV